MAGRGMPTRTPLRWQRSWSYNVELRLILGFPGRPRVGAGHGRVLSVSALLGAGSGSV